MKIAFFRIINSYRRSFGYSLHYGAKDQARYYKYCQPVLTSQEKPQQILYHNKHYSHKEHYNTNIIICLNIKVLIRIVISLIMLGRQWTPKSIKCSLNQSKYVYNRHCTGIYSDFIKIAKILYSQLVYCLEDRCKSHRYNKRHTKEKQFSSVYSRLRLPRKRPKPSNR